MVIWFYKERSFSAITRFWGACERPLIARLAEPPIEKLSWRLAPLQKGVLLLYHLMY